MLIVRFARQTEQQSVRRHFSHEAGKLPENFIEGMACEGGCVGGPSSYNDMVTTKKFRDDLLSRADDRKIRDNIANYHMETFEMHRKEQ